MLISCQATLLGLLWLSNTASAGKRSSKANLPGALNVPRARRAHQNGASGNGNGVSLDILTKSGQRNATAPLLYGWMFEDINHSGDGGLYGELLTNRGLEGSNIDWGTVSDFPYNTIVGQENECLAGGPVITGYKPSGNTSLRLDTLRPLSVSHQWTLAVDIPLSANKSAERPGLQNMGWWGIPVSPQTYNVSFFIYPDQVRNQYNLNTSITVSLQSNVTGEVFASTVIPAQPWNVVNWTHVETQIHCNVSAPDVNNTLAITFDPLEANGQTYYFSIISLFGETFKDIPNGLRKDLAQHIYDLKPKFLRWPGGNNLEGYSIQRRWKWWETVGPLRERWSRPGNWNYWNTNGLGLMEFFSWAESMEMENVLGIYSGYSLANGMGENAAQFPSTEEAMYPVLREALDELEFCLGATDTYWGSKRAEFGHPEPYVVNYVEIGNEDWFSSNYPFRFDYLYKHLKAAYPHITFIASAYNEMAGHTVDLPPGSMWDTHHYEEPQFFIDSFDFWDNWQAATNNTDVGVKIGEYSVIQVQTPSGEVDWSFPPALHIQYPRLVSALAEGVYLLGAERNPDVVRMTCYAPSLQNWNWYNWTPNLVAFDADPASTVLSTSYYLQKLFGAFHGTESLSVANGEGDFGPLYWAASVEGEDKVYLKVINIEAEPQPLSVKLESGWTSVNGTIITGDDLNGFNYKNNATAISSQPLDLKGNTKPRRGGDWKWSVPGYSITVLQFDM